MEGFNETEKKDLAIVDSLLKEHSTSKKLKKNSKKFGYLALASLIEHFPEVFNEVFNEIPLKCDECHRVFLEDDGYVSEETKTCDYCSICEECENNFRDCTCKHSESESNEEEDSDNEESENDD